MEHRFMCTYRRDNTLLSCRRSRPRACSGRRRSGAASPTAWTTSGSAHEVFAPVPMTRSSRQCSHLKVFWRGLTRLAAAERCIPGLQHERASLLIGTSHTACFLFVDHLAHSAQAPSRAEAATQCLNAMITNALLHLPYCLQYLELLRHKKVRAPMYGCSLWVLRFARLYFWIVRHAEVASQLDHSKSPSAECEGIPLAQMYSLAHEQPQGTRHLDAIRPGSLHGLVPSRRGVPTAGVPLLCHPSGDGHRHARAVLQQPRGLHRSVHPHARAQYALNRVLLWLKYVTLRLATSRAASIGLLFAD